MRKRFNTVAVFGAAILMFGIMVGCTSVNAETTSTGNSSENSQTTSPEPATDSSQTEQTPAKSDIQESLDADGNSVYDVTWSPDDTKVVFIRQEDQTSNIYVWKTGESAATLLSIAEETTSGFSWSPDSNYFLINVGHMGPGTITSTLIDAGTLETVSTELTTVSISSPVWSPDSKYIALSLDSQDGSGTIELVIYSIDSNDSISLLKSTNTYGPYCVVSWNDKGEIGYTEMTSSGDRIEKVIQAPAES